jgi:hypothetical protein
MDITMKREGGAGEQHGNLVKPRTGEAVDSIALG